MSGSVLGFVLLLDIFTSAYCFFVLDSLKVISLILSERSSCGLRDVSFAMAW